MADNIEKDMRTLVRTFSGVTTYIGTSGNARLYWTEVPSNVTPTYPYIVYFTVSSNGEHIYMGTPTADALVQFSVFDTMLGRGLDCANELFDGLSAYHGKPGSKVIHYISCMGPRVLRATEYDNVYQYVVDADVRYER